MTPGAGSGPGPDGSRGDWTPSEADLTRLIDHYSGDPVAFFTDAGFDLADTQVRILEAVQNHDRILVQSGNGTGKTAGTMLATYWYVLLRYNALGLVTSGNYGVLNDTAWPFLQTVHRRCQAAYPAIPAEPKQSPPRLDIPGAPEWFVRFRSPTYAQNLEGRHARRAIVVIDEADKRDVTAAHFDSATSTASSGDDVVIAIANPPESASNVVHDKFRSDRWEVIQFSSFDSHNCRIDTGDLPDDDPRGRIPGLVDLDLVIEDYEAWNGYDWPGVEAARAALAVDDDGQPVARPDHHRDLDPRWYRKRLGVMPPVEAGVLRPFYEQDVDDAVERFRALQADGRVPATTQGARVAQVGTDIARDGGDRTVSVARLENPDRLAVLVDRRPGDHEVNHDILRSADGDIDRRGPWVIDANGEGSGVADRLRARQSGVRRFDGGKNAQADDDWYNRASEAYAALGRWLKDGGAVPPNSDLARELRAASRVLTMTERQLRGGTTLRVDGKDTLKNSEHLGRSPDVLDAAALACDDTFDSDYVDPDLGGVVG